MKRSASLSDLPSFSVEDEDEPLEKKIKLASTAHPAEVAQPVRICRTACSSKGSVVTNKCSLVYGHAEVSHLFLTSHPSHLFLTSRHIPSLPSRPNLQYRMLLSPPPSSCCSASTPSSVPGPLHAGS